MYIHTHKKNTLMFKRIVLPFLISATLVIVTFVMFEDLERFLGALLMHMAGHKELYSWVSFFVLASDILLPVPSSIVMYTNGFALGLWQGALISLAALMLGSTIGYYLGKFTSMGVKAKDDSRASRFLEKYGIVSVLISRGIPILSESICVVCGYNRMPFRTYIILNLAGYVPLCLLYALFGSLGYDRNTFLISFGCSLLISAAFWLAGKKLFGNRLTVTPSI